MGATLPILDPWIDLWFLDPDGEPFSTPTSTLQHVRQADQRLILKISQHDEEIRGNRLMAWWNGQGAAKVFEQDGPALLMARATGPDRLSTMDDAAAIPILVTAANDLHTQKPRQIPPPDLIHLRDWFKDLTHHRHADPVLNEAAVTARELLDAGEPDVILHGDIHHENVLLFSEGWRVIDPKGLIGPSGFDFANIFSNPQPTPLDRARLSARLALVLDGSGIAEPQLVQWVMAWTALSEIWSVQDGNAAAAANTRALHMLARDIFAQIALK